MRGALLTTVLLLGAGLAGCIGSDGTETLDTSGVEDVAGTDEAGVPVTFDYHGCSEHIGLVPVPFAGDSRIFPEGFEPTPYPLDPTGTSVTVVLMSLSCSHADSEAGLDVADIDEFFFMVPVEVPEAYAADDVDLYALLLPSFVSNQEVADLYEAIGMPGVRVGDVTQEAMESPMARTGHALGTDGASWAHLYTAVAGAEEAGEAGKARLFGVEDGKISGILEASWTEFSSVSGEATYRLDQGNLDPAVLLFSLLFGTYSGIGVHAWGFDMEFREVAVPAT